MHAAASVASAASAAWARPSSLSHGPCGLIAPAGLRPASLRRRLGAASSTEGAAAAAAAAAAATTTTAAAAAAAVVAAGVAVSSSLAVGAVRGGARRAVRWRPALLRGVAASSSSTSRAASPSPSPALSPALSAATLPLAGRRRPTSAVARAAVAEAEVDQREVGTAAANEELEPSWVTELRRCFNNGDAKAFARIVMAMGATKNSGFLRRATLQEALTSRNGMNQFCHVLEGLRLGDASPHHGVELWRDIEVWFRSKRPTISNWNVVIQAFARAGLVEEALDMLRELERRSDPPPDAKTYTILVPPVAEARGRQPATSLLARGPLRGLENDSLSYMMMMVACVRAMPPDLDAAKRWLRKSEARIFSEAQVSERRPSALYNTLMSGYVKVGRLKDSFSLLGCMRRRGIKPDPYTFQILMHGCMRLSPYGTQECRQLLRVMQLMGVEPATSNYNILIRGYGTSGQLTSALRVANRMKEDGLSWNSYTYFYLISAVVQAGQVELALRLLAKMRKDGVRPQAMHYTVTFLGLAKAGFYDDAARVFERLRSLGGQADLQLSYNLMVSIKVQQGCLEEAMDIRDLMLEAGYSEDIFTYVAILDGYSRTQRWGDIAELEGDVRALRARIMAAVKDPSLTPSERAKARSALEDPMQVRNWAQAFQILTTASMWNGEWFHGVDLLEEMVDSGLPIDVRKHGRLLQDASPGLRFRAGLEPSADSSRPGEDLVEDEEERLRREAQDDWLRSVPNVRGDVPAASLLTISPDPKVRARSSTSLTAEAVEAAPQGERPAPPLVPPHVFCASFSPNWLLGSPAVSNESASELSARCLRSGEASPEDCYRAIHDYHHATVHRRDLVALRLAQGRAIVGRTAPETVESLRQLFETFGQPGAWAGTTYVFMRPAAASFAALVALLAASAAHPDSVLLVRCGEPDAATSLEAECKALGARPLMMALASVLSALPAAVLVNGSALVAPALVSGDGSETLVAGNPEDFDAALRCAVAQATAQSQQASSLSQSTAFGAAAAALAEGGLAEAAAQRPPTATPPGAWQSWLRKQGLRQLVRCAQGAVRLDSTQHMPALSRAEFFRVRALDEGRVVVDLWIEEEGGVAEFGGEASAKPRQRR